MSLYAHTLLAIRPAQMITRKTSKIDNIVFFTKVPFYRMHLMKVVFSDTEKHFIGELPFSYLKMAKIWLS